MERDFKGVWIPKEIWFDERLNALDKIILVEIDSLDCEENGCYASNKYLAEFCQCSESKITTAISKLIKLDFIYVAKFDGRRRELRSRLLKNGSQHSKKSEAEYENVGDNNIVNNEENNKDIFITESGMYDYQKIADIFNSVCVSLPKVKILTDARKRQIRAANKHIKGDWDSFFNMVEKSDFLSGRKGKWKASFDWVIKPSNTVKILEGNYNNQKSNTFMEGLMRYANGE